MTDLVTLEANIIGNALKNKSIYVLLATRLRPQWLSSEGRVDWENITHGKITKKLEEKYAGVTQLSSDEVLDSVTQLKTRYALHQMKSLCETTLKRLEKVENSFDVATFVKSFALRASKLLTTDDKKIVQPQDWLQNGYQAVIDRMALTQPPYLDLGIPSITEALMCEPGHLVILAAQTGKGKTALALNFAANLAVLQSIPTLFLNTEMSAEELSLRLLAILANVKLSAIRNGMPSQAEMICLEDAVNRWMAQNTLYISDALPWVTADDVIALTREYALTKGIKCMILDYVQRVETGNPDERWLALLGTSKQLKSLAQELKILIVMVAQLTETQHLSGSKAMKNDADAFLILASNEDPAVNATHLLTLEKSRHTPSGVQIPLIMDKDSLRFYDVYFKSKEECDRLDQLLEVEAEAVGQQ